MDPFKWTVTKGYGRPPYLESEGVIPMPGSQHASIILGQDLMTGFVGSRGYEYELAVLETLALRLLNPKSIRIPG